MKLAEYNLRVTHYQNGNPIRHAQSDEDWIDAGNKEEGAYCISPSGGYLYNWYAVNDPRGLCRVPTYEEWDQLDNVEVLKWCELNGMRVYKGPFFPQGYYAYFWSSSEYNSDNSWCICRFYTNFDLNWSNSNKRNGFSVRCLY